jgi:tetratricopeptide (TPR) repeat protein
MTILTAMTTKLKAVAISLIVIGLTSGAIAGSTYAPNRYQDSLIQKALHYAYKDSFAQAYRCLDSIIEQTPDYYPAIVVKAGVLYMEMADDESYERKDYFMSMIDSSSHALEKHLDSLPNDPWALFFLGTAYSYNAVWEGQHGSIFKTLSLGLKVGKLFGRTADIDSTFYDAYLGLGFFHYLRSAKLGILRSLPFVADQREQGIQELKKAAIFGKYGNLSAALSLGWIYYDQKKYSLSRQIIDSLIASGQDGRQVQWLKATVCRAQSDADGLIAAFESIKEGLIKRGNQNNYNLVTCDFYLGQAFYIKGDKQKALYYFEKALEYKLSPSVEKRVSKKLEAARDYRRKLSQSTQ